MAGLVALASALGAVDMVAVEENAGWSQVENTWVVVEINLGRPRR